MGDGENRVEKDEAGTEKNRVCMEWCKTDLIGNAS
jgi:hypothetical protein